MSSSYKVKLTKFVSMMMWLGIKLESPSPQGQIMTSCLSVEDSCVKPRGFHLLPPPNPELSLWFPNSRLLPDPVVVTASVFVCGLLFPSQSLWTCGTPSPTLPLLSTPFTPSPSTELTALVLPLGNLLTFLRTTFQFNYLPRMKQGIQILHKF